MAAAQQAIIEIFIKLMNFLFNTANIGNGVKIGYIILGVWLLSTLIATLGARTMKGVQVKITHEWKEKKKE